MTALTAARMLADIAPEPDASGVTGWAIIVALILVVVAIGGLGWAWYRRRGTRSAQSGGGSSPLLFAPGFPVLADAAPGGPVLIGFLLVVLVVLVVILAGIVLAIIGIRRWLKRRHQARL